MPLHSYFFNYLKVQQTLQLQKITMFSQLLHGSCFTQIKRLKLMLKLIKTKLNLFKQVKLFLKEENPLWKLTEMKLN